MKAKAKTPAGSRPNALAGAATKRLKKSWPALAAMVLVTTVAAGSVAASVPAITNAGPLGAPSASATPEPATREEPGPPPAPALGMAFFADQGTDSVAAVTIAKATYTQGGARHLHLDVNWAEASGESSPNPDLFKVTSADGKPAVYVGQSVPEEESKPNALAEQRARFTYAVGPGEASVTVKAKYTEKPTTIKLAEK